MAANNPHLQKKRTSKRSLGRSLMRRITEIPESMSRQCSKEEKDGSVGGGSASRSSSYKRRRLDSGSSSVKLKDDATSKPKVASSLKKSHSTHDHTRNAKENNLPTRHESYKEAPLLDSMMRKKLAKKASERSNSDSLDDSAPLVYKSASAHNLMAERKPLHPKPPPLQKSLSVVTSAKEKALLLTNRAYLEDSSKLTQDKEKKAATEDSTTESEASGHTEVTDDITKAAVKDMQADDTPERTVSSLLEDGSGSKDTVCPWGSVTAPSTPSENKSQKHVTYAPIRSVSINTSELPGRRHHASKKIPPEPPVRQQSLVHSLERKDVTPWDAQEQTETSSQSLKKDAKDRPVLANEHLSEMEEPLKKTEMQRNKQTGDNIPPSIPAGLTRLASIAAEVCPWEVMEVPIPKKKDPEASESDSQKSSPEKQFPTPHIPKSTMKSIGLAIKAFNRSRIRTSIRVRKDDEESPKKNGKETSEKNEKHQRAEGALMSVGGLSRQQIISRTPREKRPEIVSKQATICPWDEEEEELSSSHENRSRNVLEVCPWETSEDGLTQDRASSTEASPSTCADRRHRIKSQQESVCPWETTDDDQTREEKMSSVSPIILTAEKKAEACPWELVEVPPSTRSEAQEKASGLHDSKDTKKPLWGIEIRKSPDLSKTEEKKSRSVDSYEFSPTKFEVSTSVKTEVCPWETEDPLSKQKMSKEDNEGPFKERSTTPRAEAIKPYQEGTVCPWETMELPERIDAKTTLSQKVSDNKTNIKTAICPWETSDTSPEAPREDFKGFGDRKLRSPVSEETKDRENAPQDSVCPWDNAGDKDSSTKSVGKILELGKVVLKKSSSGDSKKVEVCPWETKTAEACPWEVVSSTLERGMKEMEGRPSKGIALQTVPPLKAPEGSIQREAACPWEDIGAEAALLKPGAKALEPRKASSDSLQSEKTEIAPWEIQEAKIDIKAAICPWESDDTQVLKKEFKKGASSLSKDEKNVTRDTAPEKGGDGKRESVCPLETTEDQELSIKPKPQRAYVSKGSSKKSDSVESFKAAVCPWETEGIEVSIKADITPWDMTPAPSDKRSSRQVVGGTLKRTGDIVAKPPEKTSSPRENVCPWETMDIDDPSSEPSANRPGLFKVGSKMSSSIDSLKAEVRPWESQEVEPSIKAALCSWEAPGSQMGESSQLKGPGAFERPAPQKEAGHRKTTEKIMSPPESICPWETMVTDKPLPESSARSTGVSNISSKKSDSTDTLKAEVCPWESQEAEPTVKAAVCPWEVPESLVDGRPSLKGAEALERHKSIPLKQTGHSKTTEKVSSPQETICPWETIETNDPSSQSTAKSPGLTKVSYKISSSTEMLKADVCPWESQEAKPSTKADVCPWEVSESSVDKRPSLKRAGAVERSKSGSFEQSVHRSEPEKSKIVSKKSDSAGSLKAEVCPWEVVEESVLRKEDNSKAHQREKSRSTSTTSISEAMEKLTRSREDVCPWESMELEGPSSRSAGQSPALSKAGSKKSDSAESLKAEVCPWEVVEESVLRKDDDSKTHQREKSRSTSTTSISEAMERLSRSREDVCPWESMELEGPSSRSAGQSPALSKAGSKKSDSAESLRSEICPWEFMEEEEVNTKTEVYPWTAAMAPFEKGVLKQDPGETLKRKQVPLETPDSKKIGGESSSFKKIEKSKSHQESVFPWKSMEFDKPPAKSTRSLDLLQVTSKKSESAESLKAEVCPWEFQEVPTHSKAEIRPWEAAEGEALKNYQGMVSSNETSTRPIMRTLKAEDRGGSQQSVSSCESMELSLSQSPSLLKGDSKKSVSVESLRAEVCPWEIEEEEPSGMIEMYPPKTAPVPFHEVSLRQNISQGKTQLSPGVIKVGGETVSKKIEKTRSHPGLPPKGTDELSVRLSSKSLDLPKVVSVKSDSVESLKAEICPWEIQEAGASSKAEVCPWEVAGALSDEEETSSRDGAAISKKGMKAGSKSPIGTIKTLEKGSSTLKSVCSWGATSAVVGVPVSKTSAIPSSKKPESSKDSRKTEICPWETGQPEKEDICPWEARTVLTTKDERPAAYASAAAMPAASVKRSQSKQEGLPGHKPLCRSLPETTPSIDLSKGSGPMVEVLAKSRHDSTIADVCPWETEEDPTSRREDSAGITKASSEVCPWETGDSEKSRLAAKLRTFCSACVKCGIKIPCLVASHKISSLCTPDVCQQRRPDNMLTARHCSQTLALCKAEEHQTETGN